MSPDFSVTYLPDRSCDAPVSSAELPPADTAGLQPVGAGVATSRTLPRRILDVSQRMCLAGLASDLLQEQPPLLACRLARGDCWPPEDHEGSRKPRHIRDRF